MNTHTAGLHHVTAVASDPQQNVDFYTDVLGLRLVKQTVNFDDTSTYHLYYGDETGTPGTILTFFPFGRTRGGQVGRGQTSATAFVIPEGSVDYWVDRLDSKDVDVEPPEERFDETVVSFTDHDGQPFELVTGASDIEPWEGGPVPTEHAIRGFHGVTLDSLDPDATADVLGTLGYEFEAEGGDRTRYTVPGQRATTIDVLDRPNAPRGQPGAGTVHHIAFRTPDDEEQQAWREHLTEEGLHVTPQKDRRYFRSIYFREPGGILFEIATDVPGFTADESTEELGSGLKLPPWLEEDRKRIDQQLADIDTGAETVVN